MDWCWINGLLHMLYYYIRCVTAAIQNCSDIKCMHTKKYKRNMANLTMRYKTWFNFWLYEDPQQIIATYDRGITWSIVCSGSAFSIHLMNLLIWSGCYCRSHWYSCLWYHLHHEYSWIALIVSWALVFQWQWGIIMSSFWFWIVLLNVVEMPEV